MRNVTVGLLVTLQARAGKEEELAEFLTGAVPLVEDEPDTIAWSAARIDEARFAIFDVFPDEDGRNAHLNGLVADALLAKADELLSEPPTIKEVEILAGTAKD